MSAPSRAGLPSRGWAPELAFALVVLGLACALSWARVEFNQVFPPGTIERVAGVAGKPPSRPFDFRMLMPALIVSTRALLGGKPSVLSVFHVYDVAAIVGAVYALRRLAFLALNDRREALLTSLALPFVLACHFVAPRLFPFWYAWDMSTVFFVTVLLVLVRERRWLVFYPLFVLATYNRETTFVVSMVYAFTALGRERWWKLGAHVVAQGALWFGVKQTLLVNHAIGAKVMTYYRPNWENNLEYLRGPVNYLWFASCFAGAWLVLLLCWRWQRDVWSRRALWVVPIYAALMFRAANWVELRIWGELIPIVLVAAASALFGRWDRAQVEAPVV